MKKIIIIGLCFLVSSSLLGCSATKVEEKPDVATSNSEDKGYNAYADIPEESIMNASSMADIDTDISNANTMYEMGEYVVLVKIDSIDGGSNTSLTGEYVHPYTYGKMTVLQVYKGDIQIGIQLDYVRLGGIVSFEDYEKGLLPTQREKIVGGMKEKPEYIKKMFGDDIDIEAGVNYLVYLTGTETQVVRSNAYPIIGMQGGLRAISGDIKDESKLEVYNNITKQWEALANVIPSN
jgi:hypothetical protein